MDYVKLNGCYRSLSEESPQQTVLDIMKVGPEAFSKQLTLIELSLFKAIQREEFASLKWNGKEKNVFAPNIVASTRWFNQTNFWVQKEILKYPQVLKRSEALSFFIKLAKKLVDYNNLYSAMAVVSALQVECIYRLRHTWDGLNNKDRNAYRRLEELYSQEQNCRRQREHMSSISLPGIPYLGVYLSDLTYTNLAHPRIGGKPTAAWNSKINAIIDTIAYFQQSDYPFVLDESINAYLCAQRYIEELQKFIEEDNYRTSLCLEPPPPSVLETSISFYPSPAQTRTLTASVTKVARDKSSDHCLNSPSLLKVSSKPASSRKYEKVAVDNSSFECDLIPTQASYEDGRSKLLLYNPASTHKDSSSAVPIQPTPITRPRHMSDGELGCHNSLNSFLCDAKQHTTSALPDKQLNGGLEPSPNRKLSDVIGCARSGNWAYRSQHDYTQKQLPPIPPRPSGGELARKQQLCASNTQIVVDLKGDELSDCSVQATSGVDCRDVNSISFDRSPISKSGILETTGKNEPGDTGHSVNHPMAPTAFGDAAVAAVSAAALAKDFTDLCQLNPPMSDRTFCSSGLARSVTPNVPVSERPEVMHHRRCASIPVPFPTIPPSPVYRVGVAIVLQGALQCRFAHSRSHFKPGFLSPKISRTVGRTASPSQSVPSLRLDQSPAQNWTLTRPNGFSAWHRLWATLVLIGNGSAAFMIYFEPKSKNAVLRHEFKAHHCQVQCLVNCSYFTASGDNNSRPGESVTESDGLLSTLSESDRTKSLDRRSSRSSQSAQSPCGLTARVEFGHHSDGTPDLHSFILYDPNGGKPCQFRSVVQPVGSHSSRALAWLRRAVAHSPRSGKSRSEQAAAATTESDLLSEANPGITTPTDSPYALNQSHSVTTPEVNTELNHWICSLRQVLSQVHSFHGQQNFHL